jgi:PAS domain S-box-containing protein
MKKRSETENLESSLRDKIIGLGERSIRKSYYPQLKQRLEEMDAVRKELAASQARYRTLVENINDVIFSVDTEGVLTYISPVIKNLTGFTPEEIVGRSFRAFIHHEDIDKVETRFAQVMVGELKPQEYRVLLKDGSFRYVSSSSRPLLKEGKVVGLTGVMSDITELKEAQIERQASAERQQQFLLQTIGAIAATVEARDPYTAGHEQRVAQLASAIANNMKLSFDVVQGITLAASIHDLGKLRVPAEILSKPAQLTPLEFELIKLHPQGGFDIVKDIQFSQPIAQMVLQHHELLDGSGYPQGLKGEEILLGARILAVADVVEAMSSHRPYRPSLGIDAALEEISRCRGKYYDPDVVDHCVILFQEKRFAFPS